MFATFSFVYLLIDASEKNVEISIVVWFFELITRCVSSLNYLLVLGEEIVFGEIMI